MHSAVWPDEILHGIHIGEHNFNTDNIIEEINQRCISKNFNYIVIRPRPDVPAESYIAWAKYLADHKVYFMFLYTIKCNGISDKKSMFSAETVEKIYKVSNGYFLGDVLGEPGSGYTFKGENYFSDSLLCLKAPQDAYDTEEAENNYIDMMKQYLEADCKVGITDVSCVEATMFSKYDLASGVKVPILEMPVGDPERLIAGVRGAAGAYGSPSWGTYVAHEWYGGRHHTDTLKRKRLSTLYNYAYLAGSKIFCIESGDEQLDSYGKEYNADHKLCREYTDELVRFNNLITSDKRPLGGPKVKVAFVYGKHDAWSGLPGSGVVWGQFDRKEWGVSSAEHSWNILDIVNRSIPWSDVTNHGTNDFGCFVPYGQYDIIPEDTSPEKLKNYELVVFVGWNTMTDEVYHNLVRYVRGGGKLIMTAAHLNTAKKRDGKIQLIKEGDVSELFGCRLKGEYESKDGFKFMGKSIIPDMLWSGPEDFRKDPCDPFWNGGYVRYAGVELCGASIASVAENSFSPLSDNNKIVLTEHKLGAGYAMLITTLDYPGSDSIYPLYKMVVTTLINNCHSKCDIKVLASDKLRFAVYEGDVLYLLNTDFDCPVCSSVIKDDKRVDYVLQPGELKRIDLKSC